MTEVGLPVDEVLGDLGAFWRRLTGDSQLRWLGPAKGAIRMAVAAIVNAVWLGVHRLVPGFRRGG